MKSTEWSIEELVRWRLKSLTNRTPSWVVSMLSVENLDDGDVPLAAASAVRRFRKLNAGERLRRVTIVVGEKKGTSPSVQDVRDALVLSLLSNEAHDVAMQIELLIDAKLAANFATFGSGRPPDPEPQPVKTGFIWSGPRGQGRLFMQCRIGTFHVGAIQHVGNDLYTATFGQNDAREHLPGQHTFEVAKKRVEEAFRNLTA